MRTTVDIDESLLRRAKREAAEKGTTLRAVIEDALRLRYLAPKKGGTGFKLRWRGEPGKLLPGVDIDDRDSLYERMEGRR
ncbi:MAG: DUF2191 domain-containing protein [Planctomycetes bacterium]|nr:DUF2191 domain-containing protein [Planctomycetota bacterium]